MTAVTAATESVVQRKSPLAALISDLACSFSALTLEMIVSTGDFRMISSAASSITDEMTPPSPRTYRFGFRLESLYLAHEWTTATEAQNR